MAGGGTGKIHLYDNTTLSGLAEGFADAHDVWYVFIHRTSDRLSSLAISTVKQ